jgi:aryl-alcohol dehydrogenase-like predicted oxidoreductase
MVNGKMSLGWRCFLTKINDMFSKISLGTVQFGLEYGINNTKGQTTKDEVSKILKRCEKVGIAFIDTAAAYGSAEDVLGEVIQSEALSNSFYITTKYRGDGINSLSLSTRESIQKLRVEKLHCQMFHSYQDFKNTEDFIKPDQVDKIGVSVYTNEELLESIKCPKIRVIQCPFNLLDNHSVRGESLKMAKEKGVEIQVRSAFLQGLFFMDRNSLPSALIDLKGPLEGLDQICSDNEITMSHLALGYCLSKDYIDKVVIGVDSLEQLNINIEAIKTPLPKFIIEEIDKITVINQKLLNPTNW